MGDTTFGRTDAAIDWIATGDSRETSERVMRAIASLAHDEAEAEAIWGGGGDHVLAVWEHATSNGALDPDTLFWGGRSLSRVLEGG